LTVLVTTISVECCPGQAPVATFKEVHKNQDFLLRFKRDYRSFSFFEDMFMDASQQYLFAMCSRNAIAAYLGAISLHLKEQHEIRHTRYPFTDRGKIRGTLSDEHDRKPGTVARKQAERINGLAFSRGDSGITGQITDHRRKIL
jgi:hypothetical protein